MSVYRLELDYIAQRRRSHWIGLTLLGVALVAATFMVLRYREAQRNLMSMEAAGLLEPARQPAHTASKERLDEQEKQVEVVVRQLALPWTQIIEALEKASIDEVTLQQLQPDAQQRVLRVKAEARSPQAMLAYLRRLGGTKVLSDVHLTSHQIKPDDPSRPIQFGVQASLESAP
jgi:Tfp pilus assembly protein PilN